jgi:hypothetical protein
MKRFSRRFSAVLRHFTTEVPKPTEIKGNIPIEQPVDSQPGPVSEAISEEKAGSHTIIKTAEEIKAEIEAQERQIKQYQEMEQMLRRTMFRGLRATLFIVFALSLYFYVLSTKGKDSRFLKWVEMQFYGPKSAEISTEVATTEVPKK